jgi:hypothetical protein
MLARYEPGLLRRAAQYLMLKETRSSYEVEREKPSQNRIAHEGRDILDARGVQTFFGDQLPGGSQQALRSLLAAVFSPEALAGHTPY